MTVNNYRVVPVVFGSDDLWDGISNVAYALVSGLSDNATVHGLFIDRRTADMAALIGLDYETSKRKEEEP